MSPGGPACARIHCFLIAIAHHYIGLHSYVDDLSDGTFKESSLERIHQ